MPRATPYGYTAGGCCAEMAKAFEEDDGELLAAANHPEIPDSSEDEKGGDQNDRLV